MTPAPFQLDSEPAPSRESLAAMPCSPIRVQRRRVKGWRKPENTVCVDRTTKWGNPFKADWPEGGKDRAWAASAFRGYYHDDPEYRSAVVRELRGKNLACFCALDGPCHADVLMDWANASAMASADTQTPKTNGTP